jgi:hypothetical protein
MAGNQLGKTLAGGFEVAMGGSTGRPWGGRRACNTQVGSPDACAASRFRAPLGPDPLLFS